MTSSKKIKMHPIDPLNLYEASRQLSKADKKKLEMRVEATIYVQDPLVAKNNPKLGLKPIWLDWEPSLSNGPTSARIAVVDVDSSDWKLVNYPARWNSKKWRFVGADDQIIGPHNINNPNFRQVNVWAIIQNIIAFFEDRKVMGRAIPWGFDGNRLIVVPHAGYAQNAFYDRTSKSLQFYYFGPEKDRVYTCLSHDIVAHETGHAILDGIRPYYNEFSSIQTAAFHEFMADLTAILSIMRNNDVRKYVADESKGDLSKKNVIRNLAEQFGESINREIYGKAARPYLRTAHNKKTMQDIEDNWSAHDCSLVMTGAMFEILTKMVFKHHPDESTKRKSTTWWRGAVWKATNHFTRLALRALDYCPTMDIQFIDYVRAILHADKLAYPLDTTGYRAIIRKVFHKRCLCSKSKKNHEGLCDLDPQEPPYCIEFRRYDVERLSRSRTAAYHFLNLNRTQLHIPTKEDIVVVDLYDTQKEAEAGRKLPREIILEYLWLEDVHLEGSEYGEFDGEIIPLLCGGTIVFDGRGNILYFVHKPGTELPTYKTEGEKRRDKMLKYIANLVKEGQIGLTDEAAGLSARVPAFVGRQAKGGLRLEVTSHLRHYSVE